MEGVYKDESILTNSTIHIWYIIQKITTASCCNNVSKTLFLIMASRRKVKLQTTNCRFALFSPFLQLLHCPFAAANIHFLSSNLWQFLAPSFPFNSALKYLSLSFPLFIKLYLLVHLFYRRQFFRSPFVFPFIALLSPFRFFFSLLACFESIITAWIFFVVYS